MTTTQDALRALWDSNHSERAHGNITMVQVCACDAIRHVEANMGTRVASRWEEEAKP